MTSTSLPNEAFERDLTIHVFSIAAGMVGACLTGIGLMRVVINQTRVVTMGDDLLAGDAVIFLACCMLAFWSFKTQNATRRQQLRWAVDTLFMLGLVIMVIVCGLITYAVT